MTNLLSFPEHRPQPEIHQVSQDHCPDRNPELSHFTPFCSFYLATPSNCGRATYRSGGGHITTIPSIPTPCPANVSRVETMRLSLHITLTWVAHITHHIIIPVLPPIGIVPVVVRFLLVPLYPRSAPVNAAAFVKVVSIRSIPALMKSPLYPRVA